MYITLRLADELKGMKARFRCVVMEDMTPVAAVTRNLVGHDRPSLKLHMPRGSDTKYTNFILL